MIIIISICHLDVSHRVNAFKRCVHLTVLCLIFFLLPSIYIYIFQKVLSGLSNLVFLFFSLSCTGGDVQITWVDTPLHIVLYIIHSYNNNIISYYIISLIDQARALPLHSTPLPR